MDSSGRTSVEPHPKALGHKLTHKCITTDYAENLLEFITGVHHSTDDLLKELTDIHTFTARNLGREMIWCQSMPALLPENDSDIPLAYYGESNVGKLKTLYRRGLGHRYGRSMQSIAGVHYNFSLSDSFWESYKTELKSDKSLMDFKNEQYFHLIRNYRRYSWILVYLFGATPTVDASFVKDKKHNLEKLTNNTYFSPEGTSLRMGGLGYTSSAQEGIGICYNRLDTYIETLEKARLTSYGDYTKIGLKNSKGDHLQLNDHLLQIDNEFYSNIRPKNLAKSRESALGALHNRGVEYIEVRLLDVDPFSPMGINRDQIHFLHLFLLWCLCSDSDLIDSKECAELDSNFDQIVRFGKKKNLELFVNGKKEAKLDVMKKLFSDMENFGEVLFKHNPEYKKAFEIQLACIENEDKMLSHKVLETSRIDFLAAFKKQSLIAKESFLNDSTDDQHDYKSLAANSIAEESIVRDADKREFDEFLKFYFDDIKLNL